MLIAIVVAVVGGALMPVQTVVNTRLSRAVSSTFLASFVSFLVGTIVLTAAVLITRPHLPGWAAMGQQPWWLWLGGLCGVVFLTLNMVLMRSLGASVTVVLPIVGQVVGGVVIDTAGLFDVERHALSVARVVGLLVVLAGAFVVNYSRPTPGAAPTVPAGRKRLLIALGVLGGVLSATQTTINGRLGTVLSSPVAASLVSFLVGLAALLVIVLVSRPQLGRQTAAAAVRPWYLVVGGALGAAFVLGSTYAAPVLGISVTVSVVLLGQLVSGLSVDRWGVLGAPRRPVGRRKVVGVLLVLAGVVCVRLLG